MAIDGIDPARSAQGIEPSSKEKQSGSKYHKLVARHGGRLVESHSPDKKELGQPMPKLSKAEKATIRKQVREARRLEEKQQTGATGSPSPTPPVNSIDNIYDIVVEVAKLAEQIDANLQPEVARNMSLLISNLLKQIDEFEEREQERKDMEHEQDRITDEIQRKKLAQEKHTAEKVKKDNDLQNYLKNQSKRPRV